MKLLITGASGFLGGHLLAVARQSYATVGLYLTFPVELPGTTLLPGDLSNPTALQKILDREMPSVIIHNAALANPEICEQMPEHAYQINVTATSAIVDWCQANAARLIYISTDLVFDGRHGNYSEDDAPSPVNVYGRTKAEAEQVVLRRLPNALVCRLALMYGRGFWRRHYASEWLERELWRRSEQPDLPPLLLFTDQWRSMLTVNNATELILELVASSINGILHLGGAERISRYDFGLRLCQKLGIDSACIRGIKTSDAPTAVPRPVDVSLNIQRAARLLKTPLLDIKSGMDCAYSTATNYLK